MSNRLILAVAGSGKTRSLVQHCQSAVQGRRILVVTFTQANQQELGRRLRTAGATPLGVEVVGWYGFLLRHFVRPFLPFKFPKLRVQGFNFEGRPHRFAKGPTRFFDSDGRAYACELGRLASELIHESGGALLRRLSACFHEVLIDEVQDLGAHDWDILTALLSAPIELLMVGDMRQNILSTNPRSKKHAAFAGAGAIEWFREKEAAGILAIEEYNETWRCGPAIAAFSDSIFDASLKLPATISRNTTTTDHDGVFLVPTGQVDSYVRRFEPRCLRNASNSPSGHDLPFINFGKAKGLTFERVLIFSTGPIRDFIAKGTPLDAKAAARFYVAVTRASQSVGIVVDRVGASEMTVWESGDWPT